MRQTPVLFLGDSPDIAGGLSRIGGDISSRLTHVPQYRVGYLGRGGYGSRKFPFVQYNFDERHQWGEMVIERTWDDFAGDQEGIIFSIWDATRLTWFGLPQYLPDSGLKRFLTSGKFKRWGYFPVDAVGPNNILSTQTRETIASYDRVLAYGLWGKQVIESSIGREVDWLPHGINRETFQPRDREPIRAAYDIGDDLLIGCVMTNQSRKDWGLAFGIIQEVSRNYPNVKFWAHVDEIEKHWSIPALVSDFGLQGRVIVTNWMTSRELSYYYSACDLVILPSLGEGFGYPLVEAMSCGVPVFHGDYGGGAELVRDKRCLVKPRSWRLDTLSNCVRPVYLPSDWAKAILAMLTIPDHMKNKKVWTGQVEHLDWRNLWPVWEKWWRKGLEQ